jgi:hypothetical protein
MSEYAQKTRKDPSGADGARAWTRPTLELISSSLDSRPGRVAHQTVHAALNQAPPVQAVAQLKRALNQSARGARVIEQPTSRPAEVATQGRAISAETAAISAVAQRYTGKIPSTGLDKKSVKAFVDEAETTKFDMRGHAVRRHGQSVTDEDKATRRNIPLDTSFDTNALIIRTINNALSEHRNSINAWLESPTSDNLVLTVDMADDLASRETQLGSGMRRVGAAAAPRVKVEGLTEATVIFRKHEVPDRKKPDQRARDTEWHLLTAYPSE